MNTSDLEKAGRLHEQYKRVTKDCDDLFNLSISLAEKQDKGIHLCLNLDLDVQIPKISVSNFENLGDAIAGIVGQIKNEKASAHVDLGNIDSLNLIRMIVKIKVDEKNDLANQLKALGFDVV